MGFVKPHKIIELGYALHSSQATTPTSGLRLTFESRRGFPADSMHASLAHANRNFHHSQVPV